MATKKSGVNVFNAVRNVSSQSFKSVVPYANENNIGEISNILFNDNYTPQYNEFVGNLVNRIVKTIISTKSFNHPLAILKKGSYPLGVDIQDIYTNPTKGQNYEFSESAMSDLLKYYESDTKVAYYRRNRRRKFPITISREELQSAFVSWEDFNKYITSLTNAVYSGNYIEEFNWTKGMVDDAYEKGYIHTEVLDADITDKETAEDFVTKVRTAFLNFAYPSENYNSYNLMNPTDPKKVVTWTQDSNIFLIIRNDVLSQVNVKALASAFNLEYADFMGRVIGVDKFDNPNVKALLCDEAFFQIYDNIFRMDEFYNASTMSWNYFLHAWNTFSISAFANAVLFITNDTKPIDSMSFASESTEVTMGSPETVNLTLTPASATNKVTFTIQDTKIATVSSSANNSCTVTPVAVGTTTLTAKSDNNKTATTTINVVAA